MSASDPIAAATVDQVLAGLARRTVLPPGVETAAADYLLIEEVGRGGMGSIWRARQPAIGRDVALKRMIGWAESGPVTVSEFLTEAVITSHLDHPCIIPVYEVACTTAGEPFYTMPLVEGEPWSRSLPFLTEDENLAVFEHVCEAVSSAHAKGIINLDLKPENVLLGRFNSVLVTDWGMARSLRQPVRGPSAVRGTPAFMAPEQVHGDPGLLSERTDIYQLGAILHLLATGVPPHPNETMPDVLFDCRDNRIARSDVTGTLAGVARTAMATRPADRFGEVAALHAAVRAYRDETVSRSLADSGQRALAKARSTRIDEDYAAALSLFQTALARWGGNQAAAEGLAMARLAYAETSAERGDLGLAERLAAASTAPGADVLHQRIGVLRTRRLQRDRRHRLLWRIAWGSLSAGLLGLLTSLWLAREAHRDLAAAALERSEAEARLAEDEQHIEDGGRWRNGLSLLFDGPPDSLAPGISLEGPWSFTGHSLAVDGETEGPANLTVRSSTTDARLLVDLVGPTTLTLTWPGQGDGDSGTLRLRISPDRLEARIGTRTAFSHVRSPPVRGVGVNLAVERVGTLCRVFLNGKLRCELAGPQVAGSSPAQGGPPAPPGGEIDNLRLDRLVRASMDADQESL